MGESEYPRGYVTKSWAYLGEMNGLAALHYTINEFKCGASMLLRDAPPAIRDVNVEVLLIDQTVMEGGTIAEFLQLPFITVCSALILNPEPEVPPALLPWRYENDLFMWEVIRNMAGYSALTLAGLPLWQIINQYRCQWSLPFFYSSAQLWSNLCQLSQQPPDFEFPRNSLPQCMHFIGPFSNPGSRGNIDFPFEKLTGQPLIYASMGTVQNRLSWVFTNIAEACAGLDVQLIISLGGGMNYHSLPALPGSPLVVDYAPQLELLARTTLTITHGGLNTVLESLSNGVPMVAIPITNDQPGVAARIAWTGTGEVISLSELSVDRLRTAIVQVLNQDSYRKNAAKIQESITHAGGVIRAANLIEQVVSTGQPAYRLS